MKTHYEQGKYYAIILIPNGHEYYKGPYHSRSVARRISIQETEKHKWALANHCHYNVKEI